jgi:hypothetical protein
VYGKIFTDNYPAHACAELSRLPLDANFKVEAVAHYKRIAGNNLLEEFVCNVTHLSCPKCSNSYASEVLTQVCECGSPLLVDYDLDQVSAVLKKDMLKERDASLWRYLELLPVKDKQHIITLGDGMTPLLRLGR